MQIEISPAVRALAVLAVVPLLATACVGNPFAPRNTAAQDSEQMRLKWAQCMRQHGVNVSDPNQSGAVTVQGEATPGAGGPSDTGDLQPVEAAMNACKQYTPNGGNGSRQVDQKTLDAMTRFAQCMRDHGIPMQDPQASGGGVRIGTNGPGSVDPNSDQFKQAQQACQHYLPSQIGQKTTSKS